MLEHLLIPSGAKLALCAASITPDGVSIELETTAAEATCPICHGSTSRVHSYYQRTLADLPLTQTAVTIQLHTRRFFCVSASCPRLTFSERLPDLVRPYARRTRRLSAEQRRLGLEIGGEPGARLAQRQGMPVSPDTLLRLARRDPPTPQPTPRVLGVDDFALRKGHVYGTILVDLERHKAVDLLPERSADVLAQWLLDHPGVEVISRDRGVEYVEGASRGAPNAVQVSDRFHLVQNLREMLQAILEGQQAALQAAQVTPTPEPPAEPASSHEEPVALPKRMPAPTRHLQQAMERRSRRHGRYIKVRELQAAGIGIREIARQTGISRQTVRRFLRAEVFPERGDPRTRKSKLDPFVAYLRARLEAGQTNGIALWRELREHHGFRGSRSLVTAWVARHRHLTPPETRQQGSRRGRPPAQTPPAAPTPRRRSARQVAWLLMQPTNKLEEEDRSYVERLLEVSPTVHKAYTLGLSFLHLVRRRDAEAFDPWLEQAQASAIPELERFAAGLERDGAAVRAALTLSYSNGQVEGQVNKLKLVKRMAYGRAKFDLLRQRVLMA
jgi:transposase